MALSQVSVSTDTSVDACYFAHGESSELKLAAGLTVFRPFAFAQSEQAT